MCHTETVADDLCQEVDGPVDNDKNLQALVQELQHKLAIADEENKNLRKQAQLEKFGICRFSQDPDMVRFYTGFRTYNEFIAFFEIVKPVAQNMKSVYYQPSVDVSRAGKPRNMPLLDELFLVLCRLRVGLKTLDLAVRLHCSPVSISRR